MATHTYRNKAQTMAQTVILKIKESEIMCKTETQNEEEKSVQTNGNGEDEAFYEVVIQVQ